MPRIRGGFSTKDPDAFNKILVAVKESGREVKLPFTATGFKSTKGNVLAEIVNEKKVEVKETEVKTTEVKKKREKKTKQKRR